MFNHLLTWSWTPPRSRIILTTIITKLSIWKSNQLEYTGSLHLLWNICVIRALNNQKFGIPPPPGIASSSNSTSVASGLKPKSKPPGRLINTSPKEGNHTVILQAHQTITRKQWKTSLWWYLQQCCQYNNEEIQPKYTSSFSFKYTLCMAQIYRKKENSLCTQMESPLKHVKEKFIAIILALSDIGACPLLLVKQWLSFNHSLKALQLSKNLLNSKRDLKLATILLTSLMIA